MLHSLAVVLGPRPSCSTSHALSSGYVNLPNTHSAPSMACSTGCAAELDQGDFQRVSHFALD